MSATSRDHQNAKGNLSARPRFQVYFSTTTILNVGRFIFGNLNVEVEIIDTDMLVDRWLDAADDLDIFVALDEIIRVIGEGSR